MLRAPIILKIPVFAIPPIFTSFRHPSLTVSRFGQTVVQIDYTPRKALVQAYLRTAPNNSTGGWHGWPADAPPPAIAPFDAEQAKAHQEAWAKYLGVPVEYTNSLGMKFRLIPPGEFLMGSTPEEIEAALQVAGEDEGWQERIKSEAPQHKVILTQPVYVGVTEVTQSQYEQMMGTNPSHFSATRRREGCGRRPGDRQPSGGNGELERRGRVLREAESAGKTEAVLLPVRRNGHAAGGDRLPAADGSGMGVRLPGGDDDAVLERR